MALRLHAGDDEESYIAVGDHIGHDLLYAQILCLALAIDGGSNELRQIGSRSDEKRAGEGSHSYTGIRVAYQIVAAHGRPGIVIASFEVAAFLCHNAPADVWKDRSAFIFF
jgi:hypothetical protein